MESRCLVYRYSLWVFCNFSVCFKILVIKCWRRKTNGGFDWSRHIPYFSTSLSVSHFSMLTHIHYLNFPLLFCSIGYGLSAHASYPHAHRNTMYAITTISITNFSSECLLIRDAVSLSMESLQGTCPNWWNLPSQPPKPFPDYYWKIIAFRAITYRDTNL